MSVDYAGRTPALSIMRTYIVEATTNDGERRRIQVISRSSHGAVTQAQIRTSERDATFLQEIHSVTFFAGNK